MHTNYNELNKSLHKPVKSIVTKATPIITNNAKCGNLFVIQLPTGVLIVSENNSTTFVPNIKVIEAPDGNAYFDKMETLL